MYRVPKSLYMDRHDRTRCMGRNFDPNRGLCIMSEVKHTPAHTGRQWSAKSCGYEKYAILDDRGTEIGFVHRRRDAHLIAAAPDLLEALKGLLADIEDYQRVNNLGGESNHWQIIARAAISKAEGRS